MTQASQITFLIPGPPVPKERPRATFSRKHTKKGAVPRPFIYTPAKTAKYERAVRTAFEHATHEMWVAFEEAWTPDAVEHTLVVRVFRARRSGDLDNFVKSIADALNGKAWPDDRHVTRIDAWMGVDPKHPRAVVTIHRGAPDVTPTPARGSRRSERTTPTSRSATTS